MVLTMSKLSKFYDKKKSEEMIKIRYKKCIPPIRLTLKKIVPTEKFQQLKENLRLNGWKDWHILLAFFNLVLNYRMHELGFLNNFERRAEFTNNFMYKEEKEGSIQIPLSEFTEKNMTISLEQSMLATLKIYGFSLKGKLLEIDEIKRFLSEKFNYWEDDVEHENIFD